MKRLPYFKWFPADADSDENFRVLTDEELGFYVRCLNHSWVNSGLPPAIEDIARSLRTPLDLVERHWVRVGKCFHIVDGRYVNKRQEEERAAATAKSIKCRDAVQTRYESCTDVGTDVERTNEIRRSSVLPRAYESESDSSSESNSEKKNYGNATIVEIEDGWGAFIEAWQEAGLIRASGPDFQKALDRWRHRMDIVKRLAAVRFLATVDASSPVVKMLPVGYLESEAWTRQGATPRNAPEGTLGAKKPHRGIDPMQSKLTDEDVKRGYRGR